MQLHQLPPIVHKNSKRLGRGYGSGKGGHTSSRGSKGTKARSKVGLLFAGSKVKKTLIQRLPKLRGRAKFKSSKRTKITLSLDDIAKHHAAAQVTFDSLVKAKLINIAPSSTQLPVVKIVSGQDNCPKTFIGLNLTQAAARQVKKAGGQIKSA